MTDKESYQPVWLMMLIQQFLVVGLVLSLPAVPNPAAAGFQRIDASSEETDEETNSLLHSDDSDDDSDGSGGNGNGRGGGNGRGKRSSKGAAASIYEGGGRSR
jgi:hypothetical protein